MFVEKKGRAGVFGLAILILRMLSAHKISNAQNSPARPRFSASFFRVLVTPKTVVYGVAALPVTNSRYRSNSHATRFATDGKAFFKPYAASTALCKARCAAKQVGGYFFRVL
jgi:hypothetical protein